MTILSHLCPVCQYKTCLRVNVYFTSGVEPVDPLMTAVCRDSKEASAACRCAGNLGANLQITKKSCYIGTYLFESLEIIPLDCGPQLFEM